MSSTDIQPNDASGGGSPKPIGEIATAIEREADAPPSPPVRELPEHEPIGEVQTAIERSPATG